MKFELKPFNRNVSDDELLADLNRVAEKVHKSSVTRNEYNQHGRFNSYTVQRRFSSWPNALRRANLDQTKKGIKKISDDRLLADLKLVAGQIKKSSLTRKEYNDHGQFGSTTLVRRFDSWFKALELADLSKTRNLHISNEELFKNLADVWEKLGRQPSYDDIRSQISKFSITPYDRFGSWRKALEAFVAWANEGETQVIEPGQSQPAKFSTRQKIGRGSEAGDALPTTKSALTQEIFRHRTSRKVNDRLRIHVILRDHCTCRICGISPATAPGTILEVDHVKSWDGGGETVLDNLQTLCKRCNGGKSNLDVYQKSKGQSHGVSKS